MSGYSSIPTPFAVRCGGLVEGFECHKGNLIFLTEKEYKRQLQQPNRRWRCPLCNAEASWDDANYEVSLGEDHG